jgi:predicted ATPase
MVDFLKELNDYYVKNRNKRIKQEFQEVLSKEVETLSGSQKHVYDIYIEPNIKQLQDTLYEAFKEAGNPIEEWRASVLEGPPSIINQVAKKMLIRAIRDMDTGQF